MTPDLHFVFSSVTLTCKLFGARGELIMEFPMHDAAVNGPGFGFRGRCPRGTYRLGEPVTVHDISMGEWFTPVLDVPGRGGIGIHGGGSGLGLAGAFAPEQPLLETLGCLRIWNRSNQAQVDLRKPGDMAIITVSGP